jgi:uncharacterized integral membrane protein
MKRLGGLEGRPEQSLYILVGVLAVALLYVVGFVVANSHRVNVDFVLFSASASLIWVILISLVLGGVCGFALARLGQRRRGRSGSEPPA